MEITNNTVVSMHYTLKNNAGEIIDSSEGIEPLIYLQGAGNIIPGLENVLMGKSIGDKLEVTVEPKDGYGERSDEMLQKLPRTEFENIEDLQPGMQFRADTAEGPQVITITDVKDDEVIIDANHPLAGETLSFAVEIIELREATETEIEHGHVHQGDDHH